MDSVKCDPAAPAGHRVMLFVVAQRGDNAKAMKVVAGVIIALGVLGLATSGKAESVGGWMAALVTG